MEQYIVTIKYHPAGSGIFDKGVQKIRINADGKDQAIEKVKKHPLFPIGAKIIRVRYAAYKKIDKTV